MMHTYANLARSAKENVPDNLAEAVSLELHSNNKFLYIFSTGVIQKVRRKEAVDGWVAKKVKTSIYAVI